MRQRYHTNILAIQARIDLYSRLYITYKLASDLNAYYALIDELVTIKLAILAHERVYGWNQ